VILRAKIWTCTKPCLLLLGLGLLLAADAAAVHEQVIYNFTSASGGIYPITGLISDAAGNLYGATEFSGGYAPGTIFELVRNGSSYRYVVLYTFTGYADGEGASGFACARYTWEFVWNGRHGRRQLQGKRI
jgi:hypothetical protein